MNHKVRGGRKEDLLGFTTVRSRIQSYVMQTRNYSPNEKVRSMEGREREEVAGAGWAVGDEGEDLGYEALLYARVLYKCQ